MVWLCGCVVSKMLTQTTFSGSKTSLEKLPVK